MIHNIARQLTKTMNFCNQPQLSKNILQTINKYSFSTLQTSQTSQTSERPKKQRQQNDFSPVDYYRNTIRRVNIRANGRGKFTPYYLQKIINMSSTQQHAKIMFQAYYNYMGHFTIIPNKVVDSLVAKAIQLGNQTQKVLQIFSHHSYLAYFPHFDITNKFIKKLNEAKDQQNLEKILRVLIRSPLIKINTKIVDTLIKIASAEDCNAGLRQYVLKVLLFRRKLIDGVNQQDLLAKISGLLQKSQIGPFQAKPMTRQAINILLNEVSISTEDNGNRLMLASTFGMIEECSGILLKEQQQIGSQYDKFFDNLIKLYSRSSQEVNYGTILKQALADAKLSINVSQKLQKLANGGSQ